MKTEELDKIDIINDTKIEFVKKECKNIGHQWKRNCPTCNEEIVYSGKYECDRATKNKCLCNSCAGYIRCKNRNSWQGSKNPWYNKKRSGILNPFFGKNHSEENKLIIAKNSKIKQFGKKRTPETRLKISNALRGKPKSEEHKRKCIINGKCGYIEWKRKYGILKSGYNPFACEYFDGLNIEMGWKLQHAKNGGEIRCNVYFLDAYDKENNIVVEYDEKNHYDVYGNLKLKDIVRMKYIIKKLKCRFFRYNEEKKTLSEIQIDKCK